VTRCPRAAFSGGNDWTQEYFAWPSQAGSSCCSATRDAQLGRLPGKVHESHRLQGEAGTEQGFNQLRCQRGSVTGKVGQQVPATALHQALDSRSKIGTAIGIVIERYQLDPDQAFGLLVRLSQNTNTKLRHVAQTLIDHATRRTNQRH
jgi:ANTAR domain